MKTDGDIVLNGIVADAFFEVGEEIPYNNLFKKSSITIAYHQYKNTGNVEKEKRCLQYYPFVKCGAEDFSNKIIENIKNSLLTAIKRVAEKENVSTIHMNFYSIKEETKNSIKSDWWTIMNEELRWYKN